MISNRFVEKGLHTPNPMGFQSLKGHTMATPKRLAKAVCWRHEILHLSGDLPVDSFIYSHNMGLRRGYTRNLSFNRENMGKSLLILLMY